MFLIIARTFNEAIKNFLRNSWLTVASVGIMLLALYIMGLIYVTTVTIDGLLKGVQERVNVSVYFKLDTPEAKILEIKDKIASELPAIKSVDYVSRNQALDDFKKNNADNPAILQSLEVIGENPLPASLVLKANDTGQYDSIAGHLDKSEFKDEIEKINYGKNKELIDRLNQIVASVRRVGLGLGILFAVIAILITFNTIRLTIYAHRQEIEVMRLVGASNSFIRLPFIFEGVIYGIAAALISMILLYITIQFMSPKISSVVSKDMLLSFYFSKFLVIFGIEAGLGAGLGIVSSVIAMRKYLKI
ncbi:MAG: permease-like cell division protein FtsX, partial [Candidatus Moranbacteria bacterium]|nr:permease-like cell division protein FtsX [Candidatus Moranbacteria bacterium]